jgi:hypothetical protein
MTGSCRYDELDVRSAAKRVITASANFKEALRRDRKWADIDVSTCHTLKFFVKFSIFSYSSVVGVLVRVSESM